MGRLGEKSIEHLSDIYHMVVLYLIRYLAWLSPDLITSEIRSMEHPVGRVWFTIDDDCLVDE